MNDHDGRFECYSVMTNEIQCISMMMMMMLMMMINLEIVTLFFIPFLPHNDLVVTETSMIRNSLVVTSKVGNTAVNWRIK